jgi:hypothetical protein
MLDSLNDKIDAPYVNNVLLNYPLNKDVAGQHVSGVTTIVGLDEK